jgi:hypothetical protein
MKPITRYIDEISGREFKTQQEAIKSEKKNGGIEKLFAFWKYPKEDQTCEFANGEWCYQRTEGEYKMFQENLIKAINKYEPWIAGQYEKHGGLKKEYVKGGTMIGRYLCDGNSELYKQYGVLSKICPVCFREWGQQYYANHCTHSAAPKEI